MKANRNSNTAISLLVLCLLAACHVDNIKQPDRPFTSHLIFPFQEQHVHGSTIVELPNGDLLSAWFQGSGERWADDVKIMGARLIQSDTAWSSPFVMADVEGFPDINPVLFLDRDKQLWLFWYPVLANQWETSIPMFRQSKDYNKPGPPTWSWQEMLFVKAGDKTERGIQPNDSFVAAVALQLEGYEAYLKQTIYPTLTDSAKKAMRYEWEKYKDKMDSLSKGRNMVRSGRVMEGTQERTANVGYPLTRRLGWQTKNKPVYDGKRLILPLYSDGFDCALFAYTNDGKSWKFSNPVLGGAGIQPTVALGQDSLIVAYLRDNGPSPNRMQRTESYDHGKTWSIPKDDLLPNPGAGCDVVTLSDGRWLMTFNDSEKGRQNLSVAVSSDNGKTWISKKAIENDTRVAKGTSSHYPAVIQSKDGRVHITYSFHRGDVTPGKSIKHISFDLDWLKSSN